MATYYGEVFLHHGSSRAKEGLESHIAYSLQAVEIDLRTLSVRSTGFLVQANFSFQAPTDLKAKEVAQAILGSNSGLGSIEVSNLRRGRGQHRVYIDTKN